MIRDYKFDPSFKSNQRRQKSWQRLFTLVIFVTGIAGATYMMGSFDEDSPSVTTAKITPEKKQSSLGLASKTASLAIPSDMTPNKNIAVTQVEAIDTTLSTEIPLPPIQQSLFDHVSPSALTSNQTSIIPAAEIPAPIEWLIHKIVSGESLALIFKAHSLSANTLHKVVNSSKVAGQLAKIRPGQTLKFLKSNEGELKKLVLIKDPVESLQIESFEGSYKSEVISKAIEKRTATAFGTIQSSLFLDGQQAGMSDGQIMEMAALFGWDVDFALEIRTGDQFRVLYEEQYLEGNKYKNGPILAAEFINKGKVYNAVRFEDSKGNVNYYDDGGHNKRRAFIRTPVKFARVSSGFTRKRWHPVLNRWRSHKGTDYAAPRGTPIKSTGSGKVVFRGRKSGYGNVVIVQHGTKYQTLYAHMSKFSSKARRGKKVKQGQTIGYVGSTGLATGPHLHYEFRVNGVHRNPLTVKLPKSLPLPKKQMAAFAKQTKPLLLRLAQVRSATMIAKK